MLPFCLGRHGDLRRAGRVRVALAAGVTDRRHVVDVDAEAQAVSATREWQGLEGVRGSCRSILASRGRLCARAPVQDDGAQRSACASRARNSLGCMPYAERNQREKVDRLEKPTSPVTSLSGWSPWPEVPCRHRRAALLSEQSALNDCSLRWRGAGAPCDDLRPGAGRRDRRCTRRPGASCRISAEHRLAHRRWTPCGAALASM